MTGVATQRASALAAAMTSTATSLTVTNSAGMASYGTVLIDTELMNYTTKSANTLSGLMRGTGAGSGGGSSTGVTRVSNGAGGLVNSSTSSGLQADISQNNTLADSSTLWNKFFNQSKASANQTYNSTNINGATGKLIWTSGLNLNTATTIVSTTAPVILIVNGNINTSATFNFYGFLYVIGSTAFNSTTVVNGALVMEGPLNTNGSVTVNLSPSALDLSSKLTSTTFYNYSFVPTYLQELFA